MLQKREVDLVQGAIFPEWIVFFFSCFDVQWVKIALFTVHSFAIVKPAEEMTHKNFQKQQKKSYTSKTPDKKCKSDDDEWNMSAASYKYFKSCSVIE